MQQYTLARRWAKIDLFDDQQVDTISYGEFLQNLFIWDWIFQ